MTDVVWITPTYPWAGEPDTGIFYRTQASALERLGQAVTVVCPTPWAPWPLPDLNPRWRHHADSPRVATDDGVMVTRPRFPNVPGAPDWSRPDRRMAAAAWRARTLWSGARLIHGHSSLTGLAAWRLAGRAGLPLVLTFHGSDINYWPHQRRDRLANLRAAASSASAIVAVSGPLADAVRDLTGVQAIHLPIGTDHRSLAAARLPRSGARRLLGLPDDRVVVLFVGNLLWWKGVRELADAILGVSEPVLGVFVGGGPEAGYGEADPRARGRLVYCGSQPHDIAMRYMSAADVLVLPSHTEGLPTVLVEAGSLGLPVIASRVGGIPELLGADRGTLLADVSAEGVAAAIAWFLDHRDEAQVAAGRLRELVLRDYDVDTNAARLLELYRAVAAGSGPTAGRRPSSS